MKLIISITITSIILLAFTADCHAGEIIKTFKFSSYILAIPLIGTIISFVLTILCLRRKDLRVISIIPIIFMVAGGALFLPGMIMDKIVVTEHSIYHTKGFWFYPTVSGFEFEGIESIRRADQVSYVRKEQVGVWVISYKNGKSIEIEPGDLWDIHEDEIINILAKKGLPLQEME